MTTLRVRLCPSIASNFRLANVRRARPRVRARQQYCENGGQEYAVKSSGPADRGDRRAEAAHLVEIGKIGPYQRAKAASDIGERCRFLARQCYCVAVTTTGMNTGTAMPRPGTGLAIQ
jgi:hypothetical protein